MAHAGMLYERASSKSGSKRMAPSRRLNCVCRWRWTNSLNLFPFYRAWRLRRYVEDHAVYSGDLVDDPAGDKVEHVVGYSCPVRGHAVFTLHGSHCDCVRVGALVSHHSHGLDGDQDREGLPDVAESL